MIPKLKSSGLLYGKQNEHWLCPTSTTSVLLYKAHPDLLYRAHTFESIETFASIFNELKELGDPLSVNSAHANGKVNGELFACRAAWCLHERNIVSQINVRKGEQMQGKRSWVNQGGYRQKEREGDWSALSSWSACWSRSTCPECVSASCGLMAVCVLCQMHNTIKLPSSIPPSISLNASRHQPSRRYADLFKPRHLKSNYPLETNES